MPKLKYDIAFLILHYGDAEITCKTIRYLLNLDNINRSIIVVVDNGCGNLPSWIYDETNVISLKDNQGFSKGNNIGYTYIKNHFDVKIIVAMNNDIFIKKRNFIDKIIQKYESNLFYVAGGDVWCGRKAIHTSPMNTDIIDANEFICEMQMLQKKKTYIKEYLEEVTPFIRIYRKSIAKLYLRRNEYIKEKYLEYKENPVLHGACIWFSELFIEKNDKLFEPETFLYAEEYFLQYRCVKNQWKMCYFPDIQVDHFDSGSKRIKIRGYNSFCTDNAKTIELKLSAMQKYIQYISEDSANE